VNTVRYSPGGEVFCSGGADGKVIIYDGKTGEKTGSLGGDQAHKGSIYAVSSCMWGEKY
jgi:WD40 repeat protein